MRPLQAVGWINMSAGSGAEPLRPPTQRPPSVDAVARGLAADVDLPQALLVEAAREAIAAGDPASAGQRAENSRRRLLLPVVNATGVLLHTNLGRAPLAVHQDATAWNLEMDLESGERSSRQAHLAQLVQALTGAEDALVVNNGAGAVLLVLSVVSGGRPVIVSRGELVEIGGEFRVPEIMALSGAQLVEVGTTNRTRVADYQEAVQRHSEVAAILKVHQSNYRIVGFTASAPVRQLAELRVPVLADLGSGLLDAGVPWLEGPPPAWLASEPAARQTLEAGAAAVTFSGDKLLGGPQAGIVAGRRSVIAACAAHPLARALRPGVMVLGALQEVLLAYLRRDVRSVPFWRMATAPLDRLEERAHGVADSVGPSRAEVVDCVSVAGGGSLPGLELPSVGVAAAGDLRPALRGWEPSVVARMQDGRTLCDLRTVEPAQDKVLAAALAAAGR